MKLLVLFISKIKNPQNDFIFKSILDLLLLSRLFLHNGKHFRLFFRILTSVRVTDCCVDTPHVPGNGAVDSSRGCNADISHAVSERLATLLFW